MLTELPIFSFPTYAFILVSTCSHKSFKTSHSRRTVSEGIAERIREGIY